jgi:hypothetical protein
MKSKFITFETYDMPGPLPEPIRLTPRHKEWRNIIGELFDLGVDQWTSVYGRPCYNGWEWVVSQCKFDGTQRSELRHECLSEEF